jgi:hypothetical protein
MDGNGFIPEEARWRLTKIESNLQQRWIRVRFSQGEYDEGGAWHQNTKCREERIVW